MVKRPEDRLDMLYTMALEFNAAMPTDVFLKGDKTIWVKEHGNDGVALRQLRQQEVLELLHTAIKYGERACSV